MRLAVFTLVGMSPRPLPRQFGRPLRISAGPERGQPSTRRRIFDRIFLYALMVLMFSLVAAIPMRLIVGSWTPWTFVVGAVCTVALFAQKPLHDRRQQRLAREWGMAGWVDVPVERSWPWDVVAAEVHGYTQVRGAKSRTVGGFPVIVADVFWMGGGVGVGAASFSGSGTIIVVTLPRQVPAPIDTPELRAAQADGRIPPWTIVGTDLYAVVDERPFKAYSATARPEPPKPRPLSRKRTEQQIARVLAITSLLPLRPNPEPSAS